MGDPHLSPQRTASAVMPDRSSLFISQYPPCQEEALDEALKNTFPASDPVSVEQPTTSGRACRS
jgi:hypothetical protein